MRKHATRVYFIGLRPRVKKGFYKNKKPIGLPPPDWEKMDRWSPARSLRGQNDYIG